MRNTICAATLVTFMLAAGPAMADGVQTGGQRMARLKAADTDGDGKVSFKEFIAAFPNADRELFDRFDTNEDGFLSPEDIRGDTGREQIRRMPNKERFLGLLRKADADGNQEVTFEELTAVAPRITSEQFDRLDRNGDGVLSRADLPAQLQGEALENRQRRAVMMRKLKQADADGDGKVTYEEICAVKPDFPRKAFDRLDVDGDGVLSREDIAHAREARRDREDE